MESTSPAFLERLEYLKKHSNFLIETQKLGNHLTINTFVNFEKYDDKGNLIVDEPAEVNQDLGDVDSSDEDDIDAHHDEIEEKTVTNKYIIEFIAEYHDLKDTLVLHWGVGRKVPNEWTAPDEKFLPPNTIRFHDGKACDTSFGQVPSHPSFTAIRMEIFWVQDIEPAVKSLSYVFMEKSKNAWYNNGSKDYHIKFLLEQAAGPSKNLPLGQIGDVVKEIIESETVHNHVTLMHRYFRCKDILSGKIDILNRDHVQVTCEGCFVNQVLCRAYLFIWLRYSFIRQLAWQKNYNTKPKELQHSQSVLTDEICIQYSRAFGKDRERFLTSDDFLRLMVAYIGKGAVNGQRVRDDILHIMHRHHISERSGHFYEQWHQKLHNNTTPDDIYICEGLLAYLRTNDIGKYWEVLHRNGITRERLESYERKITFEPYHLPDTIGSFEEYLKILKLMHSSDDLGILVDQARHWVGGDTSNMMNDVLHNYHDSDVLRQMERVCKLRYNIHQHHYDRGNTGKLKDVIFVDLALESLLRQLVEKILHIEIGFEGYLRQAAMILSNLALSYQWNELSACKEDFDKIVQPIGKNLTEDNARRVKSVIDRLKQGLAEVNDSFQNVIQSKAEKLGKDFGCDDYAVRLFSEELIRGTLFFTLSVILKKIDPHIRKSANLGDWLIISPGRTHGARGYCTFEKNLHDVMFKEYPERTVLVCEKITGEEEVPANVQAIILTKATDYPDVLAHVSVRARNLKVMLAILFDDNKANDLQKLAGQHLQLSLENGNLKWQAGNPKTPITKRGSSMLILQQLQENASNIPVPPDFPKSFIPRNEFSSQLMGAKSNNLKRLSESISADIHLPQSGTIPFKMFEYVLDQHPQIKDKIFKFIETLEGVEKVKKMSRTLAKCRELVNQMTFIEGDPHLCYLKKSLLEFGIPSQDFDKAWKSIKKVWASQFNERAFLATKKIGVSLHSVFMAVLVQKIVPAEYAYVIHTSNPTTLEENEVYVEACKGLGESLVSDFQGQAFSYIYNKQTKQTYINSYPNKPVGLHSEGFIFRSDSNSEDLPGFAGAGLFDSITINTTTQFRINYHNVRMGEHLGVESDESQDKLMVDTDWRNNFMTTVAKIGIEIEQIYKEAQDIEGCFYDGKFHVVQTRPQV